MSATSRRDEGVWTYESCGYDRMLDRLTLTLGQGVRYTNGYNTLEPHIVVGHAFH